METVRVTGCMNTSQSGIGMCPSFESRSRPSLYVGDSSGRHAFILPRPRPAGRPWPSQLAAHNTRTQYTQYTHAHTHTHIHMERSIYLFVWTVHERSRLKRPLASVPVQGGPDRPPPCLRSHWPSAKAELMLLNGLVLKGPRPRATRCRQLGANGGPIRARSPEIQDDHLRQPRGSPNLDRFGFRPPESWPSGSKAQVGQVALSARCRLVRSKHSILDCPVAWSPSYEYNAIVRQVTGQAGFVFSRLRHHRMQLRTRQTP